jgi:hypothetical protein
MTSDAKRSRSAGSSSTTLRNVKPAWTTPTSCSAIASLPPETGRQAALEPAVGVSRSPGPPNATTRLTAQVISSGSRPAASAAARTSARIDRS